MCKNNWEICRQTSDKIRALTKLFSRAIEFKFKVLSSALAKTPLPRLSFRRNEIAVFTLVSVPVNRIRAQIRLSDYHEKILFMYL